MQISQENVTLDQAITIPQRQALSSALWISGLAVLTGIGAQIVLPTVPVPFTLQTFFVLLSGALLGPHKGAAAQMTYLAMGATGLPVFAGFAGGFPFLLGPTGGYLIAFPFAAWLTGVLLHDVSLFRHLPRWLAAAVAMTAGTAAIFAMGVTQLNYVLLHDWNASFNAGFISLQMWDAVKIAAAAGIFAELGRRVAK
ncbi:MAG: biotin transporter BioY [Bacteroidetes bacterium]|nr:biotin transporter BioY [Bacteroidota bacterium]